MGERAPEVVAVPRPRKGWKGWLLVAITVLVAVWASRPRETWDALEVTTWLQAESLARDLDRTWDTVDSARFEDWAREDRDSLLPDPIVVPTGHGDVFGAPLVPSLLLAPAALLTGPRVGLVWQTALAGGLLALALAGLRREIGLAAPAVLGLFLLGSVAFPAAFHLWPDVLILALVAGGLGLAWGATEQVASGEMPDVYDAGWGQSRPRFFLRWIGAGLLLGLAASSRPFLVPVVLAVFVIVPRDRARFAGWLAGLAFAAPVAAAVAWRATVLGPGSIPMPVFDPDLVRWAGFDLLAGRHVGLLVGFAPILLALLHCSGKNGRWVPILAGTLGLVALILWTPWDVHGGPWHLGNRLLLGLYPVFWFAIDRVPSRTAGIALWALAGALVWPYWLAPRAVPGSGPGPASFVAPYLRPWLPAESTQRVLLERLDRVHAGGVDAFLLSPGVATTDRSGEFLVEGAEPFELLLRSDAPLVGLRLEAEEAAGADVELRGAELRQTVFRPDGSSGFRVGFDDDGRVHPAERNGADRWFRRLQARFPGAPARPLRVSLGGVETVFVEQSPE